MALKVTLSARMQAVADMVSDGNRVCDVGCDHGYVSIYLVQQKRVPGVLAMDINKGPLARAKEHVRQAGLSEYITLRLSDGLTAYEPGEAQTLVCAGMGGPLMQKILEREPAKTESFQEMILQPQSELKEFRRFLRNRGYSIVCEDMILEEDKFYPIIKAVPEKNISLQDEKGKDSNLPLQDMEQELEDQFGPSLLARRHPVLLEYLKREWQNNLKLQETLKGAADSYRARCRMEELLTRAECLREALKQFDYVL